MNPEPLFSVGDRVLFANGAAAEIRAIGPVFVILRFAPNDYRRVQVRAFEDVVAQALAGRVQPPVKAVRLGLPESLAFARRDQPRVNAEEAHAQAQRVMTEMREDNLAHGEFCSCGMCAGRRRAYCFGGGGKEWKEAFA